MLDLNLTSTEWMLHDVLAEVLEPPQAVDYLRWATENIVFSKRESPMPGPYNPERFSYFTEILQALSPEDPCRIVSLAKSAQLGGTVLANIVTGGTLDLDPCDFLYVHPTEDNGRRWSKMKLSPMLKGTTALRKIFPLNSSREGGDSVMYKERKDGRGAIQISGANSPASLSQVSMSRQVQDDLSKWETNSAGDPEKQADSRSQGYEFAKIFKISTPLVIPGCRITKNFEAGSQEHLYVPCPHDECGEMHTLEWENFAEHLDEDHPEKACFYCPSCGQEIHEHHRPKMLKGAEWRAKYPERKRFHRSFYLWSAYSLLQSFERIARSWIDAKGDPASEQTFMNDVVGRAYKATGEAPPWEELRDRASLSEHRRGRVPPGFVYLTCGVDCQDDRVEFQVIAWGPHRRRAVVQYGVIPGHISDDKCRAGLDALLKQGFRNSYGRSLLIDILAIDGNAYTEDVWGWVRRHPAARVIMVRGRHEEHIPLFVQVKKETNKRGEKVHYRKRFFNFATSVLKMAFYRNVRKEDPEASGHVLFPCDLEDEYFRQITAESRKPEKKHGFTVYRWVKDPNQNNEGLDTMLQAEAAFVRRAGPQRELLDHVWAGLIAERECPPEEVQGDLEDLMISPPPVVASKPVSTASDAPVDDPQPQKPAPATKQPSKWSRRTQ